MTETPKLLSIADVVTILGLSRSTVDKLINEGKLNRVKVGRRALITRGSLDSYLDSL